MILGYFKPRSVSGEASLGWRRRNSPKSNDSTVSNGIDLAGNGSRAKGELFVPLSAEDSVALDLT